MVKKEFDGTINHHRVKVIIKERKDGEKMYFAKSKNKNMITPDFRENMQLLDIHQDSPDGRYRIMNNPKFIASGVLPRDQSFIMSKGLDIAVLPIEETANEFTINTDPSGDYVDLPFEGYCLMALGTWSDWYRKKSKT